jgi:hypothetical protein
MGMIAISDDVLRDIERHAVANHMSIDKQAETFLRVAIGQTVVNEDIVTRWDRIAAMTPKAGLLQDSLVLLREDRDQ